MKIPHRPTARSLGRATLGAATLLLTLPAYAADSKAPVNRPSLPPVSSGARVIEGPGYRIERVKPGAASSGAAVPTRTLGGAGPLNQTVFCRAGEDLLIQGLRLETAGSGVVAQRGCRVRIVDSRITTGGVALIVEAGASVELLNTLLTSRAGSVEAAPNARLSAFGASFVGPATLTGADFVDRGGNVWGSVP